MSDSIDKAIAAVERRETPDPLQRKVQRAIWRSFLVALRRWWPR